MLSERSWSDRTLACALAKLNWGIWKGNVTKMYIIFTPQHPLFKGAQTGTTTCYLRTPLWCSSLCNRQIWNTTLNSRSLSWYSKYSLGKSLATWQTPSPSVTLTFHNSYAPLEQWSCSSKGCRARKTELWHDQDQYYGAHYQKKQTMTRKLPTFRTKWKTHFCDLSFPSVTSSHKQTHPP